jgi:Fe-S oxidoreductase
MEKVIIMDLDYKKRSIIKRIETESEKCIECGLCIKNCTVHDELKQTPKKQMENIADLKKLNLKEVFPCTQCRFCISVCPKEIDQSAVYQMLREYTYEMKKGFSEKMHIKSAQNHQRLSFSKPFTINDAPSDDVFKTVFFPGCSLQASKSKQVIGMYDYLKANIKNCYMMVECCGNPTLTIGQKSKFLNHMGNLKEKLKDKNIQRIIVACPNCYKALAKELPNIKIEFIWDVITKEGMPFITANNKGHKEKVFFIHDPCPTRDVSSVHESVRKIASKLEIKTDEFEYNKYRTTCCGSGAMVKLTNNSTAKKQMKKRANEAKSEYILTYCQECTESLTIDGKKAYNLSDFVFGDGIDNVQSHSTLSKWVNRYKLVVSIKQLKK